MKEFLEFVVSRLIDAPDEMILHEDTRGGGRHFLLELPRSEVGKVIGKQGHTIRAIRSLLIAAAARHGERASFEISERA